MLNGNIANSRCIGAHCPNTNHKSANTEEDHWTTVVPIIALCSALTVLAILGRTYIAFYR